MELAQPWLLRHEQQLDYLVDSVRSVVVSAVRAHATAMMPEHVGVVACP